MSTALPLPLLGRCVGFVRPHRSRLHPRTSTTGAAEIHRLHAEPPLPSGRLLLCAKLLCELQHVSGICGGMCSPPPPPCLQPTSSAFTLIGSPINSSSYTPLGPPPGQGSLGLFTRSELQSIEGHR